MNTLRFALLLPLAAWVGCSASENDMEARPETPDELEEDAAVVDTGKTSDRAKDPLQFAYIYANYMGPGTPGACGDSGCHERKRGGFLCGTTEAACFQGLVDAELVDLKDPKGSMIANPTETPLAWYGKGGSMPKATKADAKIAAAFTTWIQGGAKHDGPSTSTDAGLKDSGKGGVDATTVDATVTDAGPFDSGATDAGKTDAGKDAGKDSGPPPVTWTSVYNAYFAAGTPGHCGDSGCHLATKSGFKCGSSKDTCYAGLVSSGLVDTTNPAASDLGNPSFSPLKWFGGSMPPFGTSNSAAKTAVTAWLAAGAKND